MARQDYSWPAGPQSQNQYASAQTYHGPGPGGTKAPECEEECAEEECDPDQCGDEHRGPNPDKCFCGLDTRPLLPIGLVVTTLLGAVCMLVCQLPVLNSLIGGYEFVLGMMIAIFSILYLVTLGTTVYCALSDPGQLRRDYSQRYTAMEPLSQGQTRSQPPLPKRAHKTWLYRQPVRRYDHYCRWVTNCIGLLNHREFFLLCVGLVLINSLTLFIDSILAYFIIKGSLWENQEQLKEAIIVAIHLVYSGALVHLASPILKIHVGLVCRNELCAEWKRNDFYIVRHSTKGENVHVPELSEEEHNSLS